MLTTSLMIGIGSGMTSPHRPPEATNSATVSAWRRKWNGSLARSACVNPAEKKAADQIGICPPLRSTASRLAPMPTDATWSPGTRQLNQSQAKMRP